ncbi:MAG: glycosyltransferase, partial [Phycisphaerales bacterium]
MKVLLSSFGSAGDVRPLLGVAHALKQAGHAVVALLDPAWCEIARGAGLDAHPFGDRWDSGSIANNPDWTHPRKGSVRMLQELIIPRTVDLVHGAREAAADLKPDVLVGHHISFGLPWVAA